MQTLPRKETPLAESDVGPNTAPRDTSNSALQERLQSHVPTTKEEAQAKLAAEGTPIKLPLKLKQSIPAGGSGQAHLDIDTTVTLSLAFDVTGRIAAGFSGEGKACDLWRDKNADQLTKGTDGGFNFVMDFDKE